MTHVLPLYRPFGFPIYVARAPRLHCISAAPAALDRYPRGEAGHVAHPVRSILVSALPALPSISECFLIPISLTHFFVSANPELRRCALNVGRWFFFRRLAFSVPDSSHCEADPFQFVSEQRRLFDRQLDQRWPHSGPIRIVGVNCNRLFY